MSGGKKIFHNVFLVSTGDGVIRGKKTFSSITTIIRIHLNFLMKFKWQSNTLSYTMTLNMLVHLF